MSMLGRVTRAAGLYLIAGAVLTTLVGLVSQRTQFARHDGEGVSPSMLLAAGLAFALLRSWVAVLEGIALLFAVRRGLRAIYIVVLGTLLPAVVELALASGLILDHAYYGIFPQERWASVADLVVPILAGLCVSLWLLRTTRP